MAFPRATCPHCGRTDTPLRLTGEFYAHFPRGGGTYCTSSRKPEVVDAAVTEQPDTAAIRARNSEPQANTAATQRDILDLCDALDAARAANETCDEKRLEYMHRAEAAEARHQLLREDLADAEARIAAALELCAPWAGAGFAQDIRRALTEDTP